MSSNTSNEVKSFISRYIHSIEKLEVLLFMMQNRSDFLTVQKIHERIQTDQITLARCLEELQADGFLTTRRMPGLVYQFSCSSNDQLRLIRELEILYRDQKVKIVALIYGKSKEESLRTFSDAFKIRRKSDDQ
jgi:hypothetical protein